MTRSTERLGVRIIDGLRTEYSQGAAESLSQALGQLTEHTEAAVVRMRSSVPDVVSKVLTIVIDHGSDVAVALLLDGVRRWLRDRKAGDEAAVPVQVIYGPNGEVLLSDSDDS